MKVRDIMTRDPQCCGPDTNLAAAAGLMWSNDCGALPVIENGKLAGIITDRDICIAPGTRHTLAAETVVKDAASADVQTCAPDDDIHSVMAIMRSAKIHRLPVVSGEKKLEGIITLNDLILAAHCKFGDVNYEEVMNTVKVLSEHRSQRALQPTPIGVAATAVAAD